MYNKAFEEEYLKCWCLTNDHRQISPLYIHDYLIFAYIYSGIINSARISAYLIIWYMRAMYDASGRFSSLVIENSTFFGGSL